MATLGVSIAVPEPWGPQLQDYRVALGDVAAREIPTHITLLPPYDASAAEREALEAHLATVAAASAPFQVRLRGTGTFRPVSPVVFVNVVKGISECEQLSARVNAGPFAPETHFPYHPHVTVAHDVGEVEMDRAFDELAEFACDFEVAGFHLYDYVDGVGWQEARWFALGE
ncbi:MAG: 2'-5' RNA ligase family protein [Myxococcales bacterium]|nr:MAG: 2'-5' RNA ligase family protein [Myxococcales bacterium]